MRRFVRPVNRHLPHVFLVHDLVLWKTRLHGLVLNGGRRPSGRERATRRGTKTMKSEGRMASRQLTPAAGLILSVGVGGLIWTGLALVMHLIGAF